MSSRNLKQLAKDNTQEVSFLLPPKVKQVNFKIFNEIHSTHKFLRLRSDFDVKNCVFCESAIESLEHVLIQCESVQHSWSHKQAGVNYLYVNADASKLNTV